MVLVEVVETIVHENWASHVEIARNGDCTAGLILAAWVVVITDRNLSNLVKIEALGFVLSDSVGN